jgi:DNA-binding transcriptional LysR family regulator
VLGVALRAGSICLWGHSRAIRDLERELGLVLFVRTTRRVELTAAGSVLLERSRQALVEIDGAIADARRAVGPDSGVLGIGYGPFSGAVVTRIAEEAAASGASFTLRLEEEVTPDSLRRLAVHELAAAVVMETPGAARRHGVRIDSMRDEPLLAGAARVTCLRGRSGDSARCVRRGAGIAPARAGRAGVQLVVPGGRSLGWVRAWPHVGDVERSLGSADVAGRKRRGGLPVRG